MFFGNSKTIASDCGALSSKEIEDLRAKLKKTSSNYLVVKNSLCKRAFSEIGIKGLDEHFEGTCGVTFGESDPVIASKVLVDFAKENEKRLLRGGYVDGEVIAKSGIKELASLPSRDALLARLVGSLNSPISGMVGVLSGVLRKFVYALNAIKDKKESKEEK